jgi:hypothetical protein
VSTCSGLYVLVGVPEIKHLTHLNAHGMDRPFSYLTSGNS